MYLDDPEKHGHWWIEDGPRLALHWFGPHPTGRTLQIWDPTRDVVTAQVQLSLETMAVRTDGRLGLALGDSHSDREPDSLELFDVQGKRWVVVGTKKLTAATFLHKGSRFVSAGNSLDVHDALTLKDVALLQAPGVQSWTCLAVDPADRWAAAAPAGLASALWLFDLRTYRGRRIQLPRPAEVRCLAFSPDGHLLFTGFAGAVAGSPGWGLLWRLSADGTATPGPCILRLDPSAKGAATFTSDGRVLVVSTGQFGLGIDLWDAGSGAPLGSAGTFADGSWLVVTPSGLYDGSVDAIPYLQWALAGDVRAVTIPEMRCPRLLARLLAGERPRPPLDVITHRQRFLDLTRP